jgi:hypothetical protein
MVMLVDYSGSMRATISAVLKQTLVLVSFCKKTGIPFDVYGFTSGLAKVDGEEIKIYQGMVRHDNIKLLHLISSSMKKDVYESAYYDLYKQTCSTYYMGRLESMNSTPLSSLMTGMHHIILEFQKKYNLQKVIFNILTDGESDHLNFESPSNMYEMTYSSPKIRVGKNTLKANDMTNGVVKACVENLKTKYGVNVIGYYIENDQKELRNTIHRAAFFAKGFGYDDYGKLRNILKEDKVLAFKNVFGYNTYFIMNAKDFRDDKKPDLDIENGASKKSIRSSFNAFVKNQKSSKVFALKFAKEIA